MLDTSSNGVFVFPLPMSSVRKGVYNFLRGKARCPVHQIAIRHWLRFSNMAICCVFVQIKKRIRLLNAPTNISLLRSPHKTYISFSPSLWIRSEINLVSKRSPGLGVQKPVRFRNLWLLISVRTGRPKIPFDLPIQDRFLHLGYPQDNPWYSRCRWCHQ